MVRAESPNELATVDFYGPLPRSQGGVEYIFDILDAFSKLVKLYPMRKATTRGCLKKIFDSYIPEGEKSQRILADNGTQFTATLWKNQLESNGIKTVFSSIRHPESNPTERVMRELGRFFAILCGQTHLLAQTRPSHRESSKYRYTLQYRFRSKTNSFRFIDSRRDSKNRKIPYVIFENLEKNFRKRTKQQNNITKIKLQVGDLVLLRVRHLSNAFDRTTKKFFHFYEGPYKIAKVLSNENSFVLIEINDNTIEKGIYNQKNLRK